MFGENEGDDVELALVIWDNHNDGEFKENRHRIAYRCLSISMSWRN